MKRNKKLHMTIDNALANDARLKFGELLEIVSREVKEEFTGERQLSNLLYSEVRKGRIIKDEEGKYYLNREYYGWNRNVKGGFVIKEHKNPLDTYILKILSVCKIEEEKFKNPFDNFEDEEILFAKRAYEINKKIMHILELEQDKN